MSGSQRVVAGIGEPVATTSDVGPLTPHEQAHVDRIANGENPLAWKLAGRNAAGNLVFRGHAPGGATGPARTCFQILAPSGLYCSDQPLPS